ncbi:hypothetical protein D3C86_2156800 [compost metagenome]
MQGVKENLKQGAMAFVVFVIFMIIMLAVQGSTSTIHFVGFMMAAGNTYGVLLIICLLGKEMTLRWCG